MREGTKRKSWTCRRGGRVAAATKRKFGHAKRQRRIPEKGQAGKNYVLEPHPELYL